MGASMGAILLAAIVCLSTAASGGLRSEPQSESTNATEDLEGFAWAIAGNITLSSEAAVEAGRCQGRYMNLIEGAAPGCLAQCYSHGICGALSSVISAFGDKKDKAAAKQAACAQKGSFTCLLQGNHRAKCGVLISQASFRHSNRSQGLPLIVKGRRGGIGICSRFASIPLSGVSQPRELDHRSFCPRIR